MADIIIQNIDELKSVVIENLKEGTVLTIDLSRKEDDGHDDDSNK